MNYFGFAQKSPLEFVAKLFLSVATTLLLLLSVCSNAFAGSVAGTVESIVGDGNTATSSSFNTTRFAVPNTPLDDPVFSDATPSAMLHHAGVAFASPIWGDFDHDGDLDLFVDGYYKQPPYVYLNNGDGTFTDIFATSGISPTGDRQGSAWVDFDNDGDLDLSFIKGASHNHAIGTKKDELYLNMGQGIFRNVAPRVGVTNSFGRGRGVACGDYNKDGFVDLLVGNFHADLVLYRNNGDRTFIEMETEHLRTFLPRLVFSL
jgi:FG-GAP-like repeat